LLEFFLAAQQNIFIVVAGFVSIVRCDFTCDRHLAQQQATQSIFHLKNTARSPTFRTKTNNYFSTMSFLDKMKKAGKSVVDAGAKTMLKVSQGHSQL
jgi:hypothetical protein